MKLFPNFTSTPFSDVLISWVTNDAYSRSFLTCSVYCIVVNESVGNEARVKRSNVCSMPYMLSLKDYKTTKQTGQGEIQAKILYAILALKHGKRCHGNFAMAMVMVISHVKL